MIWRFFWMPKRYLLVTENLQVNQKHKSKPNIKVCDYQAYRNIDNKLAYRCICFWFANVQRARMYMKLRIISGQPSVTWCLLEFVCLWRESNFFASTRPATALCVRVSCIICAHGLCVNIISVHRWTMQKNKHTHTHTHTQGSDRSCCSQKVTLSLKAMRLYQTCAHPDILNQLRRLHKT